MSQAGKFIPVSGPGSGTVTSITFNGGLTSIPDPVTTTGTATIDQTNLTVLDGTVYWDTGTQLLNTTAVGTAGQVLTSQGVGMPPIYANAAASGIVTIDGDTGSITGTTVTIKAGVLTQNSGSSVQFTNSVATSILNVTDASHNTLIGNLAGNATLSGTSNVGLGYTVLNALTSGTSNVAVGALALSGITSGTSNVAIGNSAGSNYTSSETDNILIGQGVTGTLGESNITRIGTGQSKCFISGIDGVNVGSVARVVTEVSDQLGTSVITAGSGISVTPGANTITIAATGGTGTVTGLKTQDGNTVTPTAGIIQLSGGNSLTTTGTSGPNTATISLSGITQYNVQTGGAANALNNVAPSATSGVPLISQGAASQPVFGTAVVAGGGTGIATTTAYAPVCGGTTATGPFQPADSGISNSGWVLTSTGSSSIPTWQSVGSSSITITGDSGGPLSGSSFTFTGGTTGLTFAGAGTTETLGGTLAVKNGGTGDATLTLNGVLFGNGTSPVGITAAGTTNTVLLGNTSAAPSFGQVPNAALVNDSITVSPGTGISVSGSPVVLGGTVTISATGTSTLAFTGITSGPYTVLSTDNVIGVTSSSTGITVKLPNAPATGTVYTVKDSSGNSSTYNITITTVGGSITIDGATSQVVNTNYESVTVIFDGSNWEII